MSSSALGLQGILTLTLMLTIPILVVLNVERMILSKKDSNTLKQGSSSNSHAEIAADGAEGRLTCCRQ